MNEEIINSEQLIETPAFLSNSGIMLTGADPEDPCDEYCQNPECQDQDESSIDCEDGCLSLCLENCQSNCERYECEDGCEVGDKCEGACMDECEIGCEDGCLTAAETGCYDCESYCETFCEADGQSILEAPSLNETPLPIDWVQLEYIESDGH